MRNFLIRRGISFGHAFSGWWFVLRTQPNAWIHAIASVAVILMSFWLRISRQDWAMLLIAIALVWIAEFINTALEAVVDLASPSQHPLAKLAKDVAAASVLVAACVSVLIGLLVLGPALWIKLRMFFIP